MAHEYHPDARAREQAERIATLATTLAAVVADDFNAWGASVYEEHWQCHWCQARGADIDEEPREADHRAGCAWAAARTLVAEGR